MDGQKRQPLNQLLTSLTPGLMVDSAWLQAQGISRTSIHDYVRRGWLERVAPRVYRRATPNGAAAGLRWDMAVLSAQRIGSASFYVGGMTALELHGLGHFARLDSERKVHLYDPEGVVRSAGHTSELQSLMRISYAVFCLKKKKKKLCKLMIPQQ